MSDELVCAAQGPGKGPVDSLAGAKAEAQSRGLLRARLQPRGLYLQVSTSRSTLMGWTGMSEHGGWTSGLEPPGAHLEVPTPLPEPPWGRVRTDVMVISLI